MVNPPLTDHFVTKLVSDIQHGFCWAKTGNFGKAVPGLSRIPTTTKPVNKFGSIDKELHHA